MSSLPIASSVSLSSSNSFKASFDERQWVINIRRTIEDELEDDTDIPAVSIFCVPKTILATKPESYIPQHVALGPYHYLRSELYDTERYKLVAAKKIQKQLQTLKLQNVADLLIKLEPRIRSYYDKYLNFNGETLAWMMMVDASFLLEFLQIYAVKEGKILPKVPSNMSQVVDYSGMKAVHNAILRDTLLLENQIPLFVLKLIIESQYESIELGQDILNSMLIGLCKDVSPFKLKENSCSIEESMECAHLLDFIYSMIVPKSEQLQPGEIEFMEHGQEGAGEKEEGSFVESSNVKQLFDWLWAKLGKLNRGPIPYVKKILVAKPLKLVGKLPWKIITRVPGISLLAEPLGKIFSGDKEDAKPEEGSSLPSEHKPPLIEEITIPSVTELASSGVLFLPTNHDISNINFDVKTFKFNLPTINLDVHTEIVLRNLVAYEASKGSGPMVITRYTELMNGIIDTEEDAKLLREKGIVSNHLKSDVEVADLWNGMSQSVKLTKVKFLDNVIEDVNKFYSNRWKVKFKKLMKVYIFGSWQILTLLAAMFVLFLMTLQSFCSVYACSRIFGIKTSELTGLTND